MNINDKTKKVELIELSQLTREETVQFLRGELKNYDINEYLSYFVEFNSRKYQLLL